MILILQDKALRFECYNPWIDMIEIRLYIRTRVYKNLLIIELEAIFLFIYEPRF